MKEIKLVATVIADTEMAGHQVRQGLATDRGLVGGSKREGLLRNCSGALEYSRIGDRWLLHLLRLLGGV